jgi:uncharacterized repeat protein (TIGR03803 family)
MDTPKENPMRRTPVLTLALLLTAAAFPAAQAAPIYSLTTLLSFDGANGSYPMGPLLTDANGSLYGTACTGGASNYGTIFQLAAGSRTLTTLATFIGPNGRNPTGSLLLDSTGNLFGVTVNGGDSDQGTIYQLAIGSRAMTTIASFGAWTTGGANPEGGLIADASGNLYGTTANGTLPGRGIVFRCAADTHAVITLATFNGIEGAEPEGALVADAAGNLYGTALRGGKRYDSDPYEYGSVFKVASGTHTMSRLATFNGNNGANPRGGLVADSHGYLYGIAFQGGPDHDGAIFGVDPTTRLLTTLVSFNGTNGAYPEGGLIIDADGNLYGTTSQGGSANAGTVFRIDALTHELTTLVAFDGTNGATPCSGLLLGPDENLYGVTYCGGNSDLGTVFMLSPTVPEPAALLLLTLGSLLLLRRRR